MNKFKITPVYLFIAITLIGTNCFSQSSACSYLEQTVGYLYDPSTQTYKEEIRSFQRDKVCMGTHTIAIGPSTSYYIGEAISKIEEPNNKVYRMKAEDQAGRQLILEIAFTPRMTISAIYPEAFYIVYYVEED